MERNERRRDDALPPDQGRVTMSPSLAISDKHCETFNLKDQYAPLSCDLTDLDGLIRSQVAARVAERFSLQSGRGIDGDPRFKPAIAELKDRLIEPDLPIGALAGILHEALPDGEPEPTGALVLEAALNKLGKDWETDDCDFVDITIATAKILSLCRYLRQRHRTVRAAASSREICLVTPQGEQHTMMLQIMALFMEKIGWQVREATDCGGDDCRLADYLAGCDAACLFWSNERAKPAVSRLAPALRAAKAERPFIVIAGGIASLSSVDFLVTHGVDCICDSIYSAAAVAENFSMITRARNLPGSSRIERIPKSSVGWTYR